MAQNPDQPRRPVNSPKWNYQITAEALAVIRTYGTGDWDSAVDTYLAAVPGLKAKYDAVREMDRIPVTLPGGAEFTLSPGGQDVLLKSMVEDFCPRFTPGGEVLYVGDAGNKWALFDGSTAGLVYVSCFPNRAEFRKYVAAIAWETEVWCADHPTHMIHYDGEKFLGPHD